MLEFEYKGGSCVVISAKDSRLVFNPKLSIYGEKDFACDGLIQAVSSDKYKVGGSSKIEISYPGSYEVSDFSVNGFSVGSDVIYSVESHGIRIGYIGGGVDIGDDDLESIGVIDVLILTIGGGEGSLNIKQATSIARKSDAKIIIPMQYAEDGVKYAEDKAELASFAQELGYDIENVSKYKIRNINSIPEKTSIVRLK